MSYFAEVKNGRVRRVIVADQDFIDSGAVGDPKDWIETFMDGGSRKNYAGRGYSYDSQRDAFIAPKPFASWTLDEQTARWVPPAPRPINVDAVWDEINKAWVERE